MAVVNQSPNRVQLFAAPWTVAHQSPLSVGCPQQPYWSGLSFPSPGDLPDPRIELVSPPLVGGFFTTEPLGKPPPAKLAIHKCYFEKQNLMQKKGPKMFLRAVKHGWSCQLLVLFSSLKVADVFKYMYTYTHVLFS